MPHKIPAKPLRAKPIFRKMAIGPPKPRIIRGPFLNSSPGLFRNMSIVRKKKITDLFSNSRLLKGGPVKYAIKKGGPVKYNNIKLKKK